MNDVPSNLEAGKKQKFLHRHFLVDRVDSSPERRERRPLFVVTQGPFDEL